MTEAPDYRYERKLLVDEVSPEEVEWAVRRHPAAFRPLHPPRFVNNLYFDSFDRASARATVDGLADRAKVRVRWYGDLFGDVAAPALERKSKRGYVGAKQVFALPGFRFDRDTPVPSLRELVAGAELPGEIRECANALEPSVANRYRRRYYRSADGVLRLTLDTELSFFAVRAGRNTFLRTGRDPFTTVVELKYALDADDAGREAASRFPFRVTKSSKYVRGVELTDVREAIY